MSQHTHVQPGNYLSTPTGKARNQVIVGLLLNIIFGIDCCTVRCKDMKSHFKAQQRYDGNVKKMSRQKNSRQMC